LDEARVDGVALLGAQVGTRPPAYLPSQPNALAGKFDILCTKFVLRAPARGALGVVLEVDLQLVPTFHIAQSIESHGSWSALAGQAEGILRQAYSVSIFTRWSDDSPTEVLFKRKVDVNDGNVVAGRENSRSVLLGDAPQLTVRDVAVPWLQALPHFRLEHPPSFGNEIQTEYFVPVEHTGEALLAVATLSDSIQPHLIVSEVRSVAADDLWLSPAYRRDSTAIHFTWRTHADEVRKLLGQVEAVLSDFDARPHWGKAFANGPVRRGSFPRLADFAALAGDLDPTRKFTNAFVERVLGSA